MGFDAFSESRMTGHNRLFAFGAVVLCAVMWQRTMGTPWQLAWAWRFS
jgi:hypothetical protein